MNAPTISAVITTHNRPDKLLRCLKSIRDQTQSPLETIIVHDGSSADYTTCISFIADQPTMFWVDQPNQGVSVARNHGVNLANGEFIAFCDDDDYWLPSHIEALQTLILKQANQPGIYHTQRRELRGTEWLDPHILMKTENVTWQEYYITKGEMIPSATCMHQDVLYYSPFPPGVKYAEDHEQRLLAMKQFPCFPSIKRTVVMDRTHESATNRSIHEISTIYRQRLDAMFAKPDIRRHIRRPYRQMARFRWTSLELSESKKQGPFQFFRVWISSVQHVRSISNLKTLIMHLVWYLQSLTLHQKRLKDGTAHQ